MENDVIKKVVFTLMYEVGLQPYNVPLSQGVLVILRKVLESPLYSYQKDRLLEILDFTIDFVRQYGLDAICDYGLIPFNNYESKKQETRNAWT